MNKLAIALSAALSLGAAASASAQDATITFTGKIVAATCAVDIGSGGSAGAIALPEIAAGAVSSATAGLRRFDITLSADTGTGAACDKDTAQINVRPGSLDTTGRLVNKYVADVDDPATNVVVQLMDGTTPLDLMAAPQVNIPRNGTGFKKTLTARYAQGGAAPTAGSFSAVLELDVENY